MPKSARIQDSPSLTWQNVKIEHILLVQKVKWIMSAIEVLQMQDSPVYPRWVHRKSSLRLRDISYGLLHILKRKCVRLFVEPVLPPPSRAWIKATWIETFAPQMQSSRIETIETATGQRLRIATQLTSENIGKCHPQGESPLFNKLPREIRAYIFKLATAPHVAPAYRFSKRDINYRFGHEGLLVQSTTVSRMCHLAWLECNALLAQQSEHCFWFREWLSGADDTRPRAYHSRERTYNDMKYNPERYRLLDAVDRLPMRVRQRVHHLHFFASVAWLQAVGCTAGEREITIDLIRCTPNLRAKHFTVTVRHFDWWDWSKEEHINGLRRTKLNKMFSNQGMLQLGAQVVGQFLREFSKIEVEHFHLELETVQHKVAQILPIIAELQHEFLEQPITYEHSKPNGSAWFLQDGCQESTWVGPPDGVWPNAHEYADLDHLEYHCFTLSWKREPALKPVNAIQLPNNEDTHALSRVDASGDAPKQIPSLRQKYDRRFAKQNSLLSFV